LFYDAPWVDLNKKYDLIPRLVGTKNDNQTPSNKLPGTQSKEKEKKQ